MTDLRLIPCADCEGTGREHVHAPSFDDPYYMHPTNRPCPHCDEGLEVVEVEPIEMEDLP